MARNTITLIWIAGLVLAVLVYFVGPDRFMFSAFDLINGIWFALLAALRNLSGITFDLVRALAIGLWFVFAVLALLVIRRTGTGHAALLVVSLIFLGLIWHGGGYAGFGAHTRWAAALILVLVAALTMTRRLTHPAARSPLGPPPHP
ncbi:conserved membrane protein of unknown function [Rhodovastum atsumiense]|uniref:Uncharacterized protein n=1 Tax=Rhodovastum atsumiense TaxID=504468 RepID=A0A5M6IX71_9PROT|nr:hypothetical protein [Rhodovastum atsumiense]KAA5612930.1 hypothetical protein F1189_07800 [Rhodovastum atsumiense]CAH2600985.1 conserved membrane protein of unknown function [Rhodovastum atsumiense]